jgi:hypothetical protein
VSEPDKPVPELLEAAAEAHAWYSNEATQLKTQAALIRHHLDLLEHEQTTQRLQDLNGSWVRGLRMLGFPADNVERETHEDAPKEPVNDTVTAPD